MVNLLPAWLGLAAACPEGAAEGAADAAADPAGLAAADAGELAAAGLAASLGDAAFAAGLLGAGALAGAAAPPQAAANKQNVKQQTSFFMAEHHRPSALYPQESANRLPRPHVLRGRAARGRRGSPCSHAALRPRQRAGAAHRADHCGDVRSWHR